MLMKIRPPIWSQRTSVSPGRCSTSFGSKLCSSVMQSSLPSMQYRQAWNAHVNLATLPRSLSAIGFARCATHVEERADAAVRLAHDHEALVAVVEDGVVAFFGDVRRHAGQQPHARPQEFPFLLHELARVVPRRIRRRRGRCRPRAAWLRATRPAHSDSSARRPSGSQPCRILLEADRAEPAEYSKGVQKRNRPDCFPALSAVENCCKKVAQCSALTSHEHAFQRTTAYR